MAGVAIGVGAAVLLVLLYAVVVYNSMISMRNRVDESWSGIDVQLKRRHDLVPNLVETVKGYASHERELMENVTHARAEPKAIPRCERLRTSSS
jgi:LemA protein